MQDNFRDAPQIFVSMVVAWPPEYPAWSGHWGLPFEYQGASHAGPEIGYWNGQPDGYGNACSRYGYC